MSDKKDNVPAYAAMQRAAYDGFLAGLDLHSPTGHKTLDQVLGQDPAQISARGLSIAEIALHLLPIGALSPVQKAVYGRRDVATLATLAVNVTEALQVLAAQGVGFDVKPEQLQTLQRQNGAFQAFKFLGMEMTNGVLDQRAAVGAFLAFLVDRIVGAIDRRFQAQKTATDRGPLLSDFAPALLALDEVLRRPVERKQVLGAQRQDLAAQAAEARADAALAETQLKLRQSIVVPREELFAAARRHLAQTQPEALAGAAETTALPPAPGPRRIL